MAARRLAGISGTPRLDAELLMAHALHIPRDRLLLFDLDRAAPAGFEALVARRLAHEPVAYILGRRAFWTIELAVGPGALVPRPDSETLIEAALDQFGANGPGTILDLGTGPGTLLLAALEHWPEAHGLGIDRSERALRYARENARRLGLNGRAAFRLGDWTEGLDGRFDLLLCNPPYLEERSAPDPSVSREPREALFAGPDGLDDYRRLAPAIGPLLAPAGCACLEIGAGQEEAVTALLRPEGFRISARRDLSGIVRCLVLRTSR